jgi:hypothetical protein
MKILTTPASLITTIASADTPQQLSASSISFSKASLYGIKSFSATGVPTNNSDNVYAGFDVADSPSFPELIAPGDVVIIQSPPDQVWNLADLKIVGSEDDAIYVVYS